MSDNLSWSTMSAVVTTAFPRNDRWGWMTYLPPDQDIMIVSLATTTEARHTITGVDLVRSRYDMGFLLQEVRNTCIRGVAEESEETARLLRRYL